MLKKSSVSMMVLLVAASLIGMSSIYQYDGWQTLPDATAQSQQQTQITKVLIGKLVSFIFYSSSDGKACIVFAEISERLYRPNYPLGLKPGNNIGLLVPDQTMCVLLGQANIAKTEIQFYVALPALTVKALPLNIQNDLPPNQSLYKVVRVNI
jgi:hypothetical protein